MGLALACSALLPALLGLLGTPSAAAAEGASEDARSALERLSAPRAADRQAAESWLAQHLGPADLPLVALAAARADAEARRRLEIALGGDERHFELAALLAADSQVPARRLGETALTRQAGIWMGAENLAPVSALRVLSGLVDRAAPQFRVDLERQELARLLDRLARVGGAGLQHRAGSQRIEIVLDPQVAGALFEPLAPGQAGRAPPQEGDLASLLFKLTSIQGLEIEGFGFEGGRSAPAWLHLVDASQDAHRDVAQLVADWVRDLLDPREAQRRAGAARALATCGWSAPLAWLERRWLAGDGAALEGILLAASRGRVVPSLATPERVAELLAEADRALAAGSDLADARAELVLHAIGSLPAFGADGEDLRAALTRDFDSLGPRQRYLRICALAEMGSAPEEFRAARRADLARQDRAGRVDYEFELCRFLAATRGADGERAPARVARAHALFEHALEQDVAATWVDWSRAARFAPPEAWRDPERMPATWGVWPRLLVAECWLDAEESSVAAAHVAALSGRPIAADSHRVTERLRRLAAGPQRASFERALAQVPSTRASERLALLAGLVPRARHAPMLEALLAGEAGDDDLLCLGVLAVSPDEAAARRAREVILGLARPAALGDEASASPDSPWALAFERAWSDLVAAGQDRAAEDWRTELVGLLSSSTRADRARGRLTARLPLWAALRARAWPALPGNEPVPLLALESRLPRP